jgi:hypothetical protein
MGGVSLEEGVVMVGASIELAEAVGMKGAMAAAGVGEAGPNAGNDGMT